jgi:hypothetical protein
MGKRAIHGLLYGAFIQEAFMASVPLYSIAGGGPVLANSALFQFCTEKDKLCKMEIGQRSLLLFACWGTKQRCEVERVL